MLKILQTLLYGLLALIYILLIISIFQVYKDTEINPFQNNFGFEEKKNFFLYNKVYRTYYSEKEKKCKIYQDLIMDPDTQKLGDVFELNFDSIHIYCFLTLISTTILFFSLLFFILSDLFEHFFPHISIPGMLYLTCLFLIFSVCSIISSFIFFIKLVNYYREGAMDEYYEFLTCYNVNYYAFEKYRCVENLRHHLKKFIALFVVFSIVCLFADGTNKILKRSNNSE